MVNCSGLFPSIAGKPGIQSAICRNRSAAAVKIGPSKIEAGRSRRLGEFKARILGETRIRVEVRPGMIGLSYVLCTLGVGVEVELYGFVGRVGSGGSCKAGNSREKN